MAIRDRGRRWHWLALGLAPLLLGGAVALSWAPERESARRRHDLHRAAVRRADLDVTLRVPGRTDSARNTLIECEIERMSGGEARDSRPGGGEGRSTSRPGGGDGQDQDSSRYSTLLSVVPEGTYVQQGDVLCEIDPSEYVERARELRILVAEDRAGEIEARSHLEAARVALDEYRNGLRPQMHDELDREVALARSELDRQRDRMEWARRVRPLGYISAMQFGEDRQELLRCEIALEEAELARATYRRHTEPATIELLESEVGQFQTTYNSLRKTRELDEGELATLERQIAICTIRAPHEGYVIYCVDDDDPPIQAGAVVRRHMDLFHLPDLSRLEVHAEVNETMIGRLAEGMRARIQPDSMPDRIFEGTVVQIPELPDQEDALNRISGVSNYIVHIRIDERSDEPLLPGLGAQVEILTADRADALVIPAEALAVEDDRTFCYVPRRGGRLERRPVEVAPGTVELLRVVEGLTEGEEVVLHPEDLAL